MAVALAAAPVKGECGLLERIAERAELLRAKRPVEELVVLEHHQRLRWAVGGGR